MARLLSCFAILALSACAQFPQLGHQVTEANRGAGYPKLIALSQDDLSEPLINGDEVIEELDTRSANLWERIGAIFY